MKTLMIITSHIPIYLFSTSYNLHHSSDMKHNIKKWDHIQGILPIISCLKNILEIKYCPNIDVVITNTSKII
jgi:hypothetical protein